jgi:NAD(P)-dependent dehydrogenase (short-subunit alcohol dehydrogenase family)
MWLVGEKTKLAKAVAKQLQNRKFSVTNLTLDEALSADKPSELNGVLFLAPEASEQVAQEDFVLGTFQLLQKCAPALQKSGKIGRASVASVTYLGGRFGLDGIQSREQCYGAGVAGLLKTVGHEWPEVNAKAIDIASESLKSPAVMAELIVDEWTARGHSEVGITADGSLIGLALKKSPVMSADIASAPEAGGVWMISGGARGVTAAVAIELAAAWKPTLVILGRSELPESDPAWAVNAKTPQDLQKALLASGGQWTPKTAKDAVSKVLNEREIRANLQAMRNAGATVVYRAVDVRDTAAVGAVAQDIKQKFGPIRGLVHGAGVLTDKWLVEKTLPQFMAVYDTKIRGVEALLNAVDGNELRYCLLFSSSTGRFGRKGQCDYAVSNEILNKMSHYYDRKWSNARFVAVNWGPWDGGMVTPELKKLFASEGIAVIPIADGAHYVLNELSRGSSAAKEVVILGKPEASQGLKLLKKHTVSVESVPVLKDHVMNGHGVVPAALMMEWIGVAALHGQPGLVLAGIDNFKVLKGIVLKASDNVTLLAQGSDVRMLNGHYEMDVTLSSESADGKFIKHAVASVNLADDFETAEPAQVNAGKNKYPLSMNAAYETELFHGPMLHGITLVDGIDANHISATVKTATLPATWMREPSRARWLVDPLVMDSAFQLMILWARQFKNAAALPCAVGHYEQYQAEFPAGVIQVRAEITENSAHKIKATFEFLDFSGAVVARLEGYEGIVDAGLQQSFAKNKITTEARV